MAIAARTVPPGRAACNGAMEGGTAIGMNRSTQMDRIHLNDLKRRAHPLIHTANLTLRRNAKVSPPQTEDRHTPTTSARYATPTAVTLCLAALCRSRLAFALYRCASLCLALGLCCALDLVALLSLLRAFGVLFTVHLVFFGLSCRSRTVRNPDKRSKSLKQKNIGVLPCYCTGLAL
ncbi:hypothetical protein PYCCODRAFT_342531 [Trametes coccinea BRFM310]|uniref:Uncharacterized protein n=1 Tax=Trametes coccinea (strain BRFM310) TaxID=1353009 RepID=A0A1Y2J4A0_TRAC3|nr:hypothetical protein PYCCODRAFT_342531 [Trametes coccinea BRFM310]